MQPSRIEPLKEYTADGIDICRKLNELIQQFNACFVPCRKTDKCLLCNDSKIVPDITDRGIEIWGKCPRCNSFKRLGIK